MKKIGLIILIGIVIFVLSLEAVVPRQWGLRTRDEFLKGKLAGLSVSTEGVLSLAPREDGFEAPAEDFYLSFLVGREGIGYLGTGHGGKIYRLSKEGKFDLYFQAPEMDVTSLAIDGGGVLFAGTSPNGKIYKISGQNQQEVFFNPGEKYIWDLAFAENGDLMAAVGEGGGIYRINSKGEGQLAMKAEENHILCLRKDKSGGFIAGSGGVGVVYRMNAEGRVTVIFESPYEEVKSVALDQEGQVYVAACGTPSRTKKEEAAEIMPRISADVTVTASVTAPVVVAPFAAIPKEPSALYRIRADGIPKKLWESADELIYSLVWSEEGKKLVFGTGNKGRVYTVEKDDKTSLLLEQNSEQVYSLIPAETKIYALANNPSRMSLLFPEQRFSGEYVSDILDTKTVSSWGKIDFEAELPAGTMLQLQTRSGNSFEPNSMWSDWSPPYKKKEEQILSPRARYLQFKILFRTQSGKASPLVQKVGLFYLQTNVAPTVQKLELLPPNEVYLKPPEQEEAIWGVIESRPAREEKKEEGKPIVLAKKIERKGYQTAVWEAEDENDDILLYTISIRKAGEPAWRILKENWSDSLFAFDTVSLPDGDYMIKIEASDLATNPPGTELKAEKTSPSFVVDNSLPVIQNFTALRNRAVLDVAFEARDSFSRLEKAEVLLRPGEWRVVFPVDGICDSRQENFKFSLPLLPGTENLITLRVTDRYHNVGVFRQTF